MPDPAEFTRDDFLQWTDHPVTLWVARACGLEAKRLQDDWLNLSWVGGKADQERLIEMRSAAATLEIIASPTYESVCELHGTEPVES